MNEPVEPLDSGETIRGLRVGQVVFDRYVLRQLIGRGGMGAVWRAQDRELAHEVALKFLPETLAHNPTAIEDLKRETRRALDLTHPNIVRIYDFISAGPLAAISMEFVEGDTLSNLRLNRPDKVLSVAELGPIVAQLCQALDYAHHQARIVHRDLKPANLMLTGRGELKIADFGISAPLSDSTARMGEAAGSSGTPVYMSPQQMAGEPPAETDDIYSLGATLYELLTGRPPFYSGNIFAQVQGRVPPAISVRRAEFRRGVAGVAAGATGDERIPVAWENTVAACLAKNPAFRPQSVAEVLAGLGAREDPARSTGGDGAAGPRPAAAEPPARGRFKSTVVLLAAVVVALVGTVWYFARRAPPSPPSTAVVPVAAPPISANAPQPGKPWEIPGLGMKFVPVPDTRVLFSIWETRVQDFKAFVDATNHDATLKMVSYRPDTAQWGMHGDTWQSPGFAQGPTHPVVGVSANDANAFCEWLTQRERAAGRLTGTQVYRLPTDAEWNAAAGPDEFVWGNQWPPPRGVGNFADETARRGRPASSATRIIPGYDDGYAATAPVGSFPPNRLGLYDLAGNVEEYVCDRRGGVRGASYRSFGRDDLASSRISGYDSYGNSRIDNIGFRVVCQVGSVRPSRLEP